MTQGRSPVYREPCSLVPINLHDASEVEIFIHQREECGWNYSTACIEGWRDEVDAGQKALFWITLTSRDNARAGHISLDSLIDSSEPEIKNSDKSIMTIKTFFILPEYQALGIGRFCMDTLEDWATKEPYGSPNCKAIVVDTFSKTYYQDPALEAEIKRQFPDLFPPNGPERLKAQLWYERRGYVEWKRIPRYPQTTVTGEVVILNAGFLRKELQ